MLKAIKQFFLGKPAPEPTAPESVPYKVESPVVVNTITPPVVVKKTATSTAKPKPVVKKPPVAKKAPAPKPAAITAAKNPKSKKST